MQRTARALLAFLFLAGFYFQLSTQQGIDTIVHVPKVHVALKNTTVGSEHRGEEDPNGVPSFQCAQDNSTNGDNCTIPMGRSSYHPTRPKEQDDGEKTAHLLSFGPFGVVAANFAVVLGLLVALIAGTTYLVRRKRLLDARKGDKWRHINPTPLKARHFALKKSRKAGYMDIESQPPSSSSSDEGLGKLRSTIDFENSCVSSDGIAYKSNFPALYPNNNKDVELVSIDLVGPGVQSSSSSTTSFNGTGMILQRRLSSRMQYNPVQYNNPVLMRNVSDIPMNDVGQTLNPTDMDDQETKQINYAEEDDGEPMDWQSLPGPVEAKNPFALESDNSDNVEYGDATAQPEGSKDFRWDGAWEIRPEDIEVCTHKEDGRPVILGNGAFGQVFKCLHSGVTPVAVKYVKTDGGNGALTQAQYQEIRHEAGILCALRHPNIVGFIGAYLPKPGSNQNEMTPMLVMEYMEGGDLRSALSVGQDSSQLWRHGGGVHVACDILRALHALHHRGIIHFDVKSPNVLLGQGGRPAKLSDVGLAAQLTSSKYVHDQGMRGTFAWVAPEILLGVPKCTEKVDMYSFGVVLWEIVTGELPQRGRLREVKVPEECPLEIKMLIDACLYVDSVSRPSAKEAYQIVSSFEPL